MSDMFGDDDNDIELALKKNQIKRERGLIDDCRSINQQLEAATVGKILVLEHEIETLTAERDELLAELEELSLYVAYNGDDWVQKKARAAITSVKEKQNAAD